MEEFEHTAEVQFNHVQYVAVLSAYRNSSFDSTFRLLIDIENKQTCEMWRGDYQQKYIEDICAKTGRQMGFSQFVQLLKQSFLQKDNLFLDLLTQHDLMVLKARKQGLTVQ